MRTAATLVMCGLLLLAGAFDASGQSFQGGIRGAVRDANGVIPGAEVTLTNQDTNVARTTVSNDVGEYNFPNVAPGTYTVKAALTGFKTFERAGVRIGTQQFITLDLPLEVGNIQESITVTGDAPLIETSNASTGGTLDQEALESLPAPGRNAFLIGVTIPTVNHVGDPQFDRQQDQSNASRISLGGGGVRANNYLLDGVSITELTGRAILNPTIEAVGEIKVQVHTYDAEMGRTGGGVFNTTMKSGTNVFHGSGFYQTRPIWGQSENFFNEKEGLSKEETGLADAYYRLYGGGVGGPIIRDRTFFWAATEGYRSGTTRGLQEVWPGRNQRTGDFSQSTINGVPVRIFNPYCRGGSSNARCPSSGTGSIATGGEFTNAIIPRDHPAASETGFNLLNQWPTETLTGPMGTNEDNEPNAIGTGTLDDTADMIAFRADHKISDSWTLNGSYIYNKTDEPGSTLMKTEDLFIANTSEWFGPLRRRPHVLVVNNTNVLNNTTVLTLRYGWTTWYDSCDKQAFSPGLASLGFSDNFVGALGPGGSDTFPVMSFTDVSEVGGWGGSVGTRWKSPYSINGTLTKLWGSHSFKVGADFRRLGLASVSSQELGGRFAFSPNFTSRDGVGGHDLASVLVGAADSGEAVDGPGPLEWFTKYWGLYLQDDFRVNSRFTFNYGVRLEHEDGLREIENRQTVAFDRDVVNPLDALVPKTGLLAGQTLRGGLIYAGVDGAPTEQGDPAALKVAPRFGATYALNDRTVLRGGYGLFYAPWQYDVTRHGQTGFSRVTAMSQSASESEVPIRTLDDPFPDGLEQPQGSSLQLLTGVGGQVQFVDQTKGSPKVHQYSIDVQRELAGNMAVTLGYVGATGRDIGFGGTEGATFININQIDPDVARRMFPAAGGNWDAAALRASVPNPFFGVDEAGEFGTRETIQQGQLIRPFPQFGDILMLEIDRGLAAAVSRHHRGPRQADRSPRMEGPGGGASATPGA